MKVTMKKKRGRLTYEVIVDVTFDNRDPINWKFVGDADSVGNFIDDLPDMPAMEEAESEAAAEHVTSMSFKVIRCPR